MKDHGDDGEDGGAPAGERVREPEKPAPDITRITGGMQGPIGAIAVATSGLFLLAVFYTLYLGRQFFLPIAVAMLLNFLLTPAVRLLKRVGLPAPVGAAVMLVVFFGAVGYGTVRVWDPAIEWLERAPHTMVEAGEKLRTIRAPVERIREVGEQVEALASGADQGRRQTADSDTGEPGLSQTVLDRAQEFIAGGTVAIFLLYFLLALDDLFLRRLTGVLPRMSQRRKAVLIARATEHDLSHYVLVRTIINIGFGTVVGVALWLLGMPNPVLWGIMAGVLNYVPYLGGLVGYVIVGFAALTAFETTGQALLAPGVYFLLNIIEGNFITPAMLGRELTLNPVMIFIWLVFWGWIWGIPGALMAIPLLTMTKIVADNIETLSPLGAFLGR